MWGCLNHSASGGKRILAGELVPWWMAFAPDGDGHSVIGASLSGQKHSRAPGVMCYMDTEIFSIFYISDFHPNKTTLNLSSEPLFLTL